MINAKKLLVKDIIMLGFFVVCGILCIVFKKPVSKYIGVITGGIAGLSIHLIRTIKLLKNEEYKKQAEIDSKDERTLMINSKTSEIAGFVTLMACSCCGIVVLMLDRMDYLYIFGGVVLFYAIIFMITKIILNKKF